MVGRRCLLAIYRSCAAGDDGRAAETVSKLSRSEGCQKRDPHIFDMTRFDSQRWCFDGLFQLFHRPVL